MARQTPRLPFNLPTLQPQQVVPGGVTRTGAPIGLGNNARAIAGLLSETSAKLKGMALSDEQRKEEEARISAQEEFLKAKRENTLDLLRKSTLEGQIPEGMSPSFNDYRKVLLAKNAIENSYQNELNNNIGVLVDPDISEDQKASILSNAYSKTGIDELELDPVSKGIVLESLNKVQKKFDSAARQRAVEVNLSKMQQAIDTDAINVINTYNGDDEGLLDSINTSIDIAKKATVKEPTKQVLGTYLKQIDTLARTDADRALMALDAIEDASTKDGAALAGNVDIAAKLVQSRDRIENTIHQETLRAERELATQRNKVVQHLESSLKASDMNDPDKISEVFDTFLEEQTSLPVDEQLPLSVVNGIVKEKEALVNQATKVRNGDSFEIYAKQQELDLLSKSYSAQVTAASSQEEVDHLIEDIQSRDYLTIKDKTMLINNVNVAKSSFEFSSSEYDPQVILEAGGYTPETLDMMRLQFGASSEEMNDTVEHLKEFGVNVYSDNFNKAIKQLAEANNLTIEQALSSNKSYYVDADKSDLPDSAVDSTSRQDMLLDKRSNLVRQASEAAQAATMKHFDAILSTNAKLWKVKENLATDAITDSLSAANSENIRFYKDSETVKHLSPEAKGIARNTIVVTRGNLMRLSEKLKGLKDYAARHGTAAAGNEAAHEDITEKYYKMQNMLGYSLKEVINGETLAKLPLDYSRIDPRTTQIVWNKKELDFLENMSDDQGAELANKFGLNSLEELIVFQRDLMEN